MAQYILAGYLLLVGIVSLVKTEIPGWIVGLAALGTAVTLAVEKAKAAK